MKIFMLLLPYFSLQAAKVPKNLYKLGECAVFTNNSLINIEKDVRVIYKVVRIGEHGLSLQHTKLPNVMKYVLFTEIKEKISKADCNGYEVPKRRAKMTLCVKNTLE